MTKSDPSKLSDEAYLISRARQARATHPWRAKAWMTTAKLMFPQNFAMHFESYQLEKANGDAKQAAKDLRNLFNEFGREKKEAKLQEVG